MTSKPDSSNPKKSKKPQDRGEPYCWNPEKMLETLLKNSGDMGEKGFEAKQDLSWYRLIKSKGVVNIKDE